MNTFPQKDFQRNTFHEMQKNHAEEKSRKPRLLILYVGSIVR